NLEHHLEVAKPAGAKDDDVKPAVPAIKTSDLNKQEVVPPLPRFEPGADDDFQLRQAMNQLKGLPVIASTKSVAASSAVPSQVMPAPTKQ
ncbi:MAG TPA: hypothetical protein VMN56_17600, partial [Casimicrobiaceae bacterium]|nr:hypothetical protein [Casimicrobiaceae bacterium]